MSIFLNNINITGRAILSTIAPTAPIANFTYNPASGYSPLTVQFIDISGNSPTAWYWDFGDGTFSSVRNPTHEYAIEGTYTVSLTVSNFVDSSTETKTGIISVETISLLHADFSYSLSNRYAPSLVTFTDTSTGSPYAWTWTVTNPDLHLANTTLLIHAHVDSTNPYYDNHLVTDVSQTGQYIVNMGTNLHVLTDFSRHGKHGSALYFGPLISPTEPNYLDVGNIGSESPYYIQHGQDLTIEMWVSTQDVHGIQCLFDINNAGSIRLVIDDGKLVWHRPTGATILASAPLDWDPEKFYHVAITRQGNVYRIFRDGTLVASVTNSTVYNIVSAGNPFRIGYSTNNQWQFFGYIEEFRVTKNVARYTTDFTPADYFVDPLYIINNVYSMDTGEFYYTQPGTYHTSLTIFDGIDGDYVEKDIRIRARPNANFTMSQYKPYLTSAIQFIDTSDYTIKLWAKNFVAEDAYFENVALHVRQGIDSNGSATINDNSQYHHTVTSNNGATTSTAAYKTGQSSLLFSSADQSFTVASHNSFNIGTQDFTIEAWVRPTTTVTAPIFNIGTRLSGLYFGILPTTLECWVNNQQILPNYRVLKGMWTHLAISCRQGILYAFADGKLIGAGVTVANPNIGIGDITIGCAAHNTAEYFDGYLDDVKLTVGAARYTSTFSLLQDTDPFADSVVLLLGQSSNANVITDASFANSPVTSIGNVHTSVATFQIGNSSIKFGGNTNRLSASIPELYDFTIEFWVHPTAAWTSIIRAAGTEYCSFKNSSNIITLCNVNTGVNASIIPSHQWTQVAYTRYNSDVGSLFINGKLVWTGTVPTTIASCADLQIGGTPDIGGFTGYLNGLRITNNAVRYFESTALIELDDSPTAHMWKIERKDELNLDKTVLLVHGNGTNNSTAFVDSSKYAHTFTTTNAATRISTVHKKFGSGSIYVDGQLGEWIEISNPNDFAFGTGDFTVEFWVKPIERRQQQICFSIGAYGIAGDGGMGIRFDISDDNAPVTYFILHDAGVTSVATAMLQTNQILHQWTHVAAQHKSGIYALYINGVLEFETNYGESVNLATVSRARIGSLNNHAIMDGEQYSSYTFKGYIDDIRVTKGVARYSGNFTVPQGAYYDYESDTVTSASYLTVQTTNSATLSDISYHNRPITLHGSAALSNSQASTSRYAISMPGNAADYVSVPASAHFDIGSTDFTIEAWVYISGAATLNSTHTICGTYEAATSPIKGWRLTLTDNRTTINSIRFDTTYQLGSLYYNNPLVIPITLPFGEWHHICAVRTAGVATYATETNLVSTLNNPNAHGSAADDTFGDVVAIDGDYAIVSSYNETADGVYRSGVAYIFNVTTGALVHTLLNPNAYGTTSEDWFGVSADISGNFAIVGAQFEDSALDNYAGKAYIFNVLTGTVIHILSNPSATPNEEEFGCAVAIDGNYAIVGARDLKVGAANNGGRAYIYNATTGTLLHTLVDPNPYGDASLDLFGHAVAISGNFAIVSARQEDEAGQPDSGKAYIFNVTTGALVHTLNNPNAYGIAGNDIFGVSVDIKGNYAIVGAYGEGDANGTASGKAYIFNVTTGVLMRTLTNPNTSGTSTNDYFGESVGISDTYAIVGAQNESDMVGGVLVTRSGKAYVFDIVTGELVTSIGVPNLSTSDAYNRFGDAVAISGATVIIGAPYTNDTNEAWTGKAHILNLSTVAVTSSGTMQYYIDGKSYGLPTAINDFGNNSQTLPLRIGNSSVTNAAYAAPLKGYVDNVRISRIAKYTNTFIPDSNFYTAQYPLKTFTESGAYAATLTIHSPYYDESVTRDITIDGRAPIANFIYSPSSGVAPLTVTFTDTSLYDPTAWKWKFTYGDPYFAYVTLLVYADSEVNTVAISDSSLYNTPISIQGNAIISTYDGMFGSSSIWLNNNQTGLGMPRVYAPANSGWAFLTKDFTVELWINPTFLLAESTILGTTVWNSGYIGGWHMSVSTTGSLTLCYSGNVSALTTVSTGPGVINTDQWQHIALVRYNGRQYVYVDGKVVLSVANTLSYASQDLLIGARLSDGVNIENFYGYLDEIRITKNIARYTANFTVPNKFPNFIPYDYIDTAILTIIPMSTDITPTDRSNYNRSMIISGTAAISTTKSKSYGASLYFPGAYSDYVTVPASSDFYLSGTDFTIEAWVNISGPAQLNSKHTICATLEGSVNPRYGWTVTITDGLTKGTALSMQTTTAAGSLSTAMTSTTDFLYGTWYHIAIVRKDTTVIFYKDGVMVGTAKTLGTFGDKVNGDLHIGGMSLSDYAAMAPLNGYIDNLRITRAALYTANFTPEMMSIDNISYEQNPSHVFTKSGKYSVELTASNFIGSDVEYKTEIITVAASNPPVASFAANPTTGAAGMITQFLDASTGLVTSRIWNTGDDVTSGTMLYIKGNGGDNATITDSSTYSRAITVTGTPITSTLAYKYDLSSLKFTGSTNRITSSLPSLPSYTVEMWIYPTSTSWAQILRANDASSYMNFGTSGSYIRACGVVTTVLKTDIIINKWTHIAYTRNSSASNAGTFFIDGVKVWEGTALAGTAICNNLQIGGTTSGGGFIGYIDNFKVSNLVKYVANFNPEYTSSYFTDTNPVHIYTEPGTYSPSLTSTNSGGSDTYTRTNYITVGAALPLPIADFTFAPAVGSGPLQVAFTNTSTNGITFLWDFGDGTPTVGYTNPIHIFTTIGVYSVTLTAYNTSGENTMAQYGIIEVTANVNETVSITPTTWQYGIGENPLISISNAVPNSAFTIADTDGSTISGTLSASGTYSTGGTGTGLSTKAVGSHTLTTTFAATGNTRTNNYTVSAGVTYNEIATLTPTSWVYGVGEHPLWTITGGMPYDTFTATDSDGIIVNASLDGSGEFTNGGVGSGISTKAIGAHTTTIVFNNTGHTRTISYTVENNVAPPVSLQWQMHVVEPPGLPTNWLSTNTIGTPGSTLHFFDGSSIFYDSWISRTVTYGDGTSVTNSDAAGGGTLSHVYPNAGDYTVTLTHTYPSGDTTVNAGTVTITEAASTTPVLNISYYANLVHPIYGYCLYGSGAVGAVLTLTDTTQIFLATWISRSINYGDGTIYTTSVSGDIVLTHTYTTPGVYTVTLTHTTQTGPTTGIPFTVTITP